MGRSPTDVAPRVAVLLRQRRRELSWSLRQVEERAAALGVRLPTSTLVRIERGKLDPGVRRLFTIIHVYNVEMLADAMELGALAGGRTPRGSLEELTARGEAAWMAGDIAQALAHALAVREHEADDPAAHRLKQRALIAFATYARNLGKYRLARQLVDGLLRQPLARNDLVDALVLAASVWRGLGSLEAALAMVERAAKRVEPEDLKGRARVEHQWAKLLLEEKDLAQAEAHLELAIALYARAADGHNEARARVLRVELLEKQGKAEVALEAAGKALLAAERGGFARETVAARLERARLLLARGRAEEAFAELSRGLASAVELNDRRLEFFARAGLWRAQGALGDEEAAAFELRRAAHLAERMDENEPQVTEVRSALRVATSVHGLPADGARGPLPRTRGGRAH